MVDSNGDGWARTTHANSAVKMSTRIWMRISPCPEMAGRSQEAGGGTIRCHDPAIQSKIFALLGLTPEQAEEKFGFLLSALRHGAPPHGGIALGLDRLTMLYAGLNNIRDCIAFPKTAKGTDLMTGAPGTVEGRQLRELHIRLAD